MPFAGVFFLIRWRSYIEAILVSESVEDLFQEQYKFIEVWTSFSVELEILDVKKKNYSNCLRDNYILTFIPKKKKKEIFESEH